MVSKATVNQLKIVKITQTIPDILGQTLVPKLPEDPGVANYGHMFYQYKDYHRHADGNKTRTKRFATAASAN